MYSFRNSYIGNFMEKDLASLKEPSLALDSYEIRELRGEEDKAQIFRLRYDVYVEEMQRKQKHALHERRLVVEPLDGTAALLGAFAGTRAVGTCRINFSSSSSFENRELYDFDSFERIYPGRVAFITKMIVRPEYRRGPLFRDLSKAVYRAVAERGCGVMVIDCNDHLVNAFTRQGFVAYRGKQPHPDFGHVTPMALYINDLEHLEKVRSPFLAVAKELPQNN
jgi:hypothetical protein